GADPAGRHQARARNGSRRGPRHAPGEDAPRVEGDRRRALGPRRQGRPRRGEGARAGGQVSRLATTFDELRARGERALVAYFTAGDRSLAETQRLVLEAAARGADVIELAVPFSDPIAGGPRRARAEVAAVALVHPVGPTAARGRARLIAGRSRGLRYLVSLTGVTGERRELPRELEAQIRTLRRLTTKPVCVGFGIGHPDQVAAVGRLADGVIVGSAIVRLIEERAGTPTLVKDVGEFIASLKAPLRVTL